MKYFILFIIYTGLAVLLGYLTKWYIPIIIIIMVEIESYAHLRIHHEKNTNDNITRNS